MKNKVKIGDGVLFLDNNRSYIGFISVINDSNSHLLSMIYKPFKSNLPKILYSNRLKWIYRGLNKKVIPN